MFEHIPFYPGDPILSLVELFHKDERKQKVNLSIGLFYDEDGNIPLLPPVREAEDLLVAQHKPRSYLPMEGAESFRQAARAFIFGDTHEAVQSGRIASVQTLGGSGALKLTADFIHQFFPQTQVWISDPTWENHRSIFSAAGVKVNNYPYYDSQNNQVRFDELLACIRELPAKSLVLMHPCCHNPTGMDLTQDQWKLLFPVFRERQLMAFLDMAYQGFGKGIDEDAWAVREFAAQKLPCFVGSSFSKSMSWYGERTGSLHVLCKNKDEAACVLGQMKKVVRQNYSSPPIHGVAVATMVLQDDELRRQWMNEVNRMRERIQKMRVLLASVISQKVTGRNFSYLTQQQGMFSYTGLTPQQVERLREEFAVYMLSSGRMCVAGLNHRNVEYVADSMASVLSK